MHAAKIKSLDVGEDRSKKDVTNKNVKTARMVTTQDFPTLGLPSPLLQFDSFLLKAVCKMSSHF